MTKLWALKNYAGAKVWNKKSLPQTEAGITNKPNKTQKT